MNLISYQLGEEASRPWGSWKVLEVYSTSILKRIIVNPGCRLSLQSHRHRSELWTVVRGVATVERDGEIMRLDEGEVVELPQGCRHRLSNTSEEPLIVVELQRGDILSEEDIERYEDDYNRLSDSP